MPEGFAERRLSSVVLPLGEQLLERLVTWEAGFGAADHLLPRQVQDVVPGRRAGIKRRLPNRRLFADKDFADGLSCVVRHHPFPNSVARRVAASTASINTPRTPPRSRACNPAMVVPPGLATASFSAPGCCPVSSTIRAEPSTVCAASAVATSRGKPTRTPPSDRASIMR